MVIAVHATTNNSAKTCDGKLREANGKRLQRFAQSVPISGFRCHDQQSTISFLVTAVETLL